MGKILVDDYELVHSEKKVPSFESENGILLEQANIMWTDRVCWKDMEDVNVDQEAEEFVDEQDAHEKDQNETEFDYQMNEPVERNNKYIIL
ncbi:hypothetical protein B9Z55_026077 [Caenorhabditis nigoni]|uniref:Uncharacterized protein n=1 Tax=Caenorhabditis nigoni TaxID=1611254 RepID=A0A2G5T1T5_9PELO|nr:hypothetical protein B9Z55_026077 [Caenorhabditis nigoni]